MADDDRSEAPYGVVDLGDKIIVGAPHGQQVELSDELKRRVQDVAKRHGAWYEGTGGDIEPNKGLVPKYHGSWDDAYSSGVKGYPVEYLSPMFSNVDVNRPHEVFEDPKRTIMSSLIANQDKMKYFKDRRYDEKALRDFLKQGSEGDIDFLKMSQLPATKENLNKFFRTGESLAWPENWQEYPHNLGKMAKKTEEGRNKYLLDAPPGVYFTGAGHIPELRSMKKDLKVIGGERAAYADGGIVEKALRLARRGYATDGSVEDVNPEHYQTPIEIGSNEIIANDTDNAARLDVGAFQKKTSNRNPMPIYEKLNDLTQKEIGLVPSVEQGQMAYNFFSNKPINYKERIENLRSKGTSTVIDPEGRTGDPVFVAGTTPEGKNIPLTESAQAALGSTIARITARNTENRGLRGVTHYDPSVEKELAKQGKTGQFISFQPGYTESGENAWEVPGDMTGMRSTNPDYWRKDAEDVFRQRMADQNTLAHEVGHALHNIGGIDLNSFKYKMPDNVRKEFTQMNTYRTSLGSGEDKPVPFMPKSGEHDAFYVTSPEEMFAEATRRYMANPAAFKRMYPNAAKYMRGFVNTNPKLNKLLMLSRNEGPQMAADGGVIDDALRLANGGSLPMRLPYGQRYNPKSDKLDAPSSKGIGFRGPLSQGDHIVSEYSSDRDIQYPSVYEGISPEDTAAVLMAERLGRAPPRDVDDRAYEAARRRMDRGQSPFFEQGKDKYPAWSPDQQWEKPAIMPEREEPLMYSTGGAMKLNLAVDDALRVAKGVKNRKDKYNSETRKEGGQLKLDPNAEARKLIAEIDEVLQPRNEVEEFAKGGKAVPPRPAVGSDAYWAERDRIYAKPPIERLNPEDPTRMITPEEYRKGNIGRKEYVLADGGRTGYATGGEPTNLPTDNAVLEQPDPTRSYVQSLYQNIMGRQGEQGGLDYWADQLNQGNVSQADVLQQFAKSNEFQNLYKQDPSKAVSALYQTALGRAPEQGGLDYWTGQAKQGLDLGQMVSGFTGSDEGQDVQAINQLYQQYTGKTATPEQISQYRNMSDPEWQDFVGKAFPDQNANQDSYEIAGKPVSRSWESLATPVPKSSEELQQFFGPLEQQYNLPKGSLLGMMGIESTFGKNQLNAQGYKGAFQFGRDAINDYNKYHPDTPLNSKNIYDWKKAAEAAAWYARYNADQFKQRTGRDPLPHEFYNMHQQGMSGYSKIAANPNKRAVDVLGSRAKVALNMPPQLKGKISPNNITGEQFINGWAERFNKFQAGPDEQGKTAVASWYENNPRVQTASSTGTPGATAADPNAAKVAALAADKAAWEKKRDDYINDRINRGLSATLPPELTNYTPGAGGTVVNTGAGSLPGGNIGTTLTNQGAGGNVTGSGMVNPNGTIIGGTTSNPQPSPTPNVWTAPGTGTTSGASVISPIPGTGMPQWDYQTGLTQNSPIYMGNTPVLPWQAGDAFAGGIGTGAYNSGVGTTGFGIQYNTGGMFKHGGVVKPDEEDVENALRVAKKYGGRRVNTKVDKDPAFDMSLKSGGGAWTRKEGKNPEGGLNAKGRASAKAEGHNLKPPAPHPKSDKDAARRKSFCARMKGMKAKLTSSETANDPDSRINKSLRVWNCHSDGGAVDNALRLAKGGDIWDKPRPKSLGESDALSKSQKKSAKASAKAAGRPYPNLVDNMRAAQRKK